jgi:hypothetical protein
MKQVKRSERSFEHFLTALFLPICRDYSPNHYGASGFDTFWHNCIIIAASVQNYFCACSKTDCQALDRIATPCRPGITPGWPSRNQDRPNPT